MITAILILNYNNPIDTINCIDSIQKYNTGPVKFFIVDNASPSKECVPIIDSWLKNQFENDYIKIDEFATISRYPYVTFITASNNNGYACGNNIGLKFIYQDVEITTILVLNNDILFIEDIIPRLKLYLAKLPDAAIVSPLLFKKDGVGIDKNCARKDVNIFLLSLQYLFVKKNIFGLLKNDKQYILNEYSDVSKVDFLEVELPSGSCMLLNSSFFKVIDSFDPRTFLYYEENILYRKIKNKNKKIYIIPALKSIHLGASTISKHTRRYDFDKKCDYSTWIYVNYYSESSNLLILGFNISFYLYSIIKYLIYKFKHFYTKIVSNIL